MDKEAWETLQNTQDRVKQAVNQRFEKDASLYVDRARQDSLKTMLRNGNYQAVAVQQKCGLAPEALARVIVENAWLLPHGPYEPLLAVLYHCRPGYLSASGIMKKVLEDDYDLPKDFRDEVATLCIADADSHTAEAMLESGSEKLPFLNNPRLWTACLHTALKPLPSLEKYRRFSEYETGKEGAYAQPQWKALNQMFDKASLTPEVLDAVFHDHFETASSPGYPYWRHVFEQRLPPDALLSRMEHFFEGHTRDFDGCRKIWFSVAPAIRTEGAMQAFEGVIRRFAPIWHANRMDALGRQIVRKLQERTPQFAERAAAIFSQAGIQVEVRDASDLPDVDELARRFNAGEVPYENLRRLAKDFNNKYWKQQPVFHLQEILKKLDSMENPVYWHFCVELAKKHFRFPPYLIYLIDHVHRNRFIKKSVLEIVQKNDLLRSQQFKIHPGELEKVKSFVQEQDFELFKKLMS